MKIKHCVITLATAVALTGCKPDDQQVSTPATNSAELKQQAKDDLSVAKDSAVQTKDEFLAAMDKKMQVLDANIKDLSDKSANYTDDAKVQSDKALANLRGQRAIVQEKYDQLKQSSQDAWDKTKDAFSAAWTDMQKAYDDAKAKFK